ncbi:Glucokinase [hydrothermal vent metagenome]|uniref:Glucokinase n=1 Tax=hydrothermal vent metagenome TaxID=652676 RepID=A0A3B0XBL1_9ZZZZ
MIKLAGDIGGTHSRIALLITQQSKQDILIEKTYLSTQYSSLTAVIEDFLLAHKISLPIDAVCFAVAGPVVFGALNTSTAKITNLPWKISEQEISKSLNTNNVKLINDFSAAAYGVTTLAEDNFSIIYHGKRNIVDDNIQDAVIMGAGTGLGVAHIVSLTGNYHVYPSEAGHVGFAPVNILQCELLIWLYKKHQHVSLEMLLSGNGLMTIYQFMHDIKKIPESSNVIKNMKLMDPAEVISEAGLLAEDELCRQSLDVFVDIYAAAASNVVLHYYPVKVLYIAGGIAPKIIKKLNSQPFINTYLNKGSMSYIIEKVTVKLVLEDKVGLIGALSLV